MARTLPLAVAAALGCALAAQRAAPAPAAADLVVRNGVIATLDARQPQVQSLAVRGGRIEAMGTDAAMAAYVNAHTRILDLHGAFVTPGFIEGHGHLTATGEDEMELKLGPAPNWDAIVAMVKAAVAQARPGEWIVGAGWQQSKWNRAPQPSLDGLPDRAAAGGLDAVSPHNPVLLEHASGHGVFVNAAALKLAGITARTPDPSGGTIVRNAGGRAIGMLRDSASAPVQRAYAEYRDRLPAAVREAQASRALQLAVRNEISKGITTFVDMGESFHEVDWLKQQSASAGLPLRLYVNISGESVPSLAAHLPAYRTIDPAKRFTVRGVGEILSDGALGTRSAWFLQPYSDAPTVVGKNVVAMSTVAQIAALAAQDGFQLSVHAIGDRANHETLDLFQRTFAAHPGARALRWRIEHAQHLSPADIPRFAQLGVIASMQSIHACSDAPFVVERVGEERARAGAYAWRSLIASGAMIAEGTDTPVEDTNPIPNFYCGVTRDDGHGHGFFPAQVKSRLEELRSYTWNNAYAIFADHDLGSLSPGKLADMDVFSGDLLTMPADQILRTRVLYTMVGGKIVFQRAGAAQWRPGTLFRPLPEFDHVY